MASEPQATPKTSLFQSIAMILFGLLLGLVILEAGLWLIPKDRLLLWIAPQPLRFELHQSDPRMGWRLRPNVHINYTGAGEYDVDVQINALGLNDTATSYDAPPETYRILMLGDSFVEGIQVDTVDGFPYLLEQCLAAQYDRPVEVINGGVAYYATAEQLFFLQHEGVKYEPDLVLLAFYTGNDIDAYAARQQEDKWFDGLGGYLVELDEAGTLQTQWIDWQNPSPYEDVSAVDLFLRQYSRIYYVLAHSNSRVNDWLTENLPTFSEETAASADAPAPDFRENLELMVYSETFPDGPDIPAKLVEAWAIIDVLFSEIQAETAQMGADFGVLIIPEKEQASVAHFWHRYNDYSSRYGMALEAFKWDYSAPNRALAAMLAEKNIATLDLLPLYRQHYDNGADPLYFDIDSHLNEQGHRVTADAACQWVMEQGYIE